MKIGLYDDELKKKKKKKGKKHNKNKKKKMHGKKYNKKYIKSWSGKLLDAIDVKLDVKSNFDVTITDESLNHAINTSASLIRDIILKKNDIPKIENKK